MSKATKPAAADAVLEDRIRFLRAMTPEQVLAEIWPYLDLSPEERDRRSQELCKIARAEWRALSAGERARRRRNEEFEKRLGYGILRRWAREFHEV